MSSTDHLRPPAGKPALPSIKRRLALTNLPPALTLTVIPIAAFTYYSLVYGPLPSLPSPDVAYYLLGVRHLASGKWPWGSEPPLSFLVLSPFRAIFGDHLGFLLVSAAIAAVTFALLGVLAYTALKAQHEARRKIPPGTLLGIALTAQILAFAYASPQYASGFLKNALANALMALALLGWVKRRHLATAVAGALAVLAHPGAVVPLIAAACLYPLTLGPERVHQLWSQRERLRRLVPRRLISVALAAGAGAVALGIAAWPTISRYAATYFRSPAGGSAPFAGWSLDTLIIRYLPIWVLLAWAGLSSLRPASRNQLTTPLVRLSWAWAFALIGLSAVGGPAGRRLEIQLFIPVVLLAAASLYPCLPLVPTVRHPPGPRRSGWLARQGLLLVALVFGMVVLASPLHTRPLLDSSELAMLAALGQDLPVGTKLVAHATNAVYWAEYLTGLPVIGPNLLPLRGLTPGPTFVLSEDPLRDGGAWSVEALDRLQADALLVRRSGRFLLIAAEDNPEFFAGWSTAPQLSALELVRLARPLRPAESAATHAGSPTRALGWLFFAPTLGY